MKEVKVNMTVGLVVERIKTLEAKIETLGPEAEINILRAEIKELMDINVYPTQIVHEKTDGKWTRQQFVMESIPENCSCKHMFVKDSNSATDEQAE